MDPQFLMQRYWGSEDEDDHQDEENKNNSIENQMVKVKAESSDVECIDVDDSLEEDEDILEIENVSKRSNKRKDSPVQKKPKKKLKSSQSNDEGIEVLNQCASDVPDAQIKVKATKKKAETKENTKKIKEIKKKGTENKQLDLESSNNQYPESKEIFKPIGKITRLDESKVDHVIPNWLSNPIYIEVDLTKKETPISELSYLDSNSKNNLTEMGISYLFPVQLAVIPWLLQSKEKSMLIRPSDICVSAPTGSGKTLAFVLPIVQSLKDRVVCCIRALVVLPVNELAIQVYKVFESFVRGTDLKVALLTGQKSFLQEQNALIKQTGNKVQSCADIVVTSPGRVTDHILRTKGFCLKKLRYLVIDEADRMLIEIQQGWLKQVEEAVFNDIHSDGCVCRGLERQSIQPSSAHNFGLVCQPLQKLLYSATLTHNPEQLHSLALYKPKLFTTLAHDPTDSVIGRCALPQSLKMMQVTCDTASKPMAVCHIIRKFGFKKVLCFTETVERAHRLHLVLEEMKQFEVREISSFNRAVQRKIVLEQFASGIAKVLICSDLVARGIDIENIDCVLSYDIPQFVKTYVHRIGRTARAGKPGVAITLMSDGQVSMFRKLLQSAEIPKPEVLDVLHEDLKPFVSSYQKALESANTKLREESSNTLRKKRKARKKK